VGGDRRRTEIKWSLMHKNEITPVSVSSIEELISEVRGDYLSWETGTFPWFRGEPLGVETPLLPKLYRPRGDGKSHNENRLIQSFRIKAPSLGLMSTPPRANTDEWLFLAQHVGLPTRLLDWTEGLFIALYFALLEEEPVVWMLDPIELNRKSSNKPISDNVFPLTWFDPEMFPARRTDAIQLALLELENLDDSKKQETIESLKLELQSASQPNLGNLNIRGAWETDKVGTEFPVAIHPVNIHTRISSQKSCFTIQGKKKLGLAELVEQRVLSKYEIKKDCVNKFRDDLRIMGITPTSVFPDLDSLAKELASLY